MTEIKLKGSSERIEEIKKLIDKMWEDPLRIGHFPKPVIVWDKKWSGLNWMCKSDEWIVCSGHGNTVQEAYDDWLKNYSVDIIYDED